MTYQTVLLKVAQQISLLNTIVFIKTKKQYNLVLFQKALTLIEENMKTSRKLNK